jgi:hypothetical protein
MVTPMVAEAQSKKRSCHAALTPSPAAKLKM